MKIHSKLPLLFVILALALAACGTAAPVTPASEPTTAPPVPTTIPNDPIAIVRNYYAALNAGDFETMATFMADDMVATYPGGKYAGKSEVITANENAIRDGLQFELSDLKDMAGRVTSCFKVRQNNSLIDQGCTGVTIVRRGQIIFDGLASDEPEFVVERYYQALNAEDLELAMSFVASDALFINPTGKYEGTEEIQKSLADLNVVGITFELSNFRDNAGVVVYDYKVIQNNGILDRGTNGLTQIKDGLIVFDGTEYTFAAR